MATPLTLGEIRLELAGQSPLGDPFAVLKILCQESSVSSGALLRDVRDLIIRMLGRREELNGYAELLDSLAISVGLYPYANADSLGTRDALEYEAHRPEGLDDLNIVFHRTQALIYQYLLDGESVILSAPTSFGKSLIIDGLLASGKYDNIAVVVPTIALVDETRRRISERFRSQFKVITHPSQSMAARNVIVMTQERVLDIPELPELDLFVIDEFYKLDPRGDRDRSNTLNQAFYRLRKASRQFYMLGPNIEQLPEEMNEFARVVVTDFATVAIDTFVVQRKGDDLSTLNELCATLDEPTIIFCRSPAQARTVADSLRLANVGVPSSRMIEAANWIGREYHPEWSFDLAIASGIGLHHGRIPRSLAQLVVQAFNAGDLKFLVCTSTLIEGVNTAAKNVVIYDHRIAMKKYDFFTFNNIRGRSGRMFQHFVGHVYLFHPQPAEELPLVDVPAVTQLPGTDASLLVQIDDQDLSEEARQILELVLNDEILPRDEIRDNSGIDPALQIELARRLRETPRSQLNDIAWSGFPIQRQLVRTCQYIWDDLDGKRFRTSYVRTPNQLAYRLSRLAQDGVSGLLRQAINEEATPDEAIEDVLDFTRNWAGFHFPRLLKALDRIQRRVLVDLNMNPGNYGFYLSRVESLFLPTTVLPLEEYGIPLQISLKFRDVIDLDQPLDNVLAALKNTDLNLVALDEFERAIVGQTLESL